MQSRDASQRARESLLKAVSVAQGQKAGLFERRASEELAGIAPRDASEAKPSDEKGRIPRAAKK